MILKKMGMGMEMTLQYAPIRLADQAVMIETKPIGQIPRTVTRSVTRKNARRTGTDVPLMLERRKISIQGR